MGRLATLACCFAGLVCVGSQPEEQCDRGDYPGETRDTAANGGGKDDEWARSWGSESLRWLWGTPVYSTQIELSATDREELVRIITAQYFRIEDALGDGGTLSPAEVNDAFYEWQQNLDHEWMHAREACFHQAGLPAQGPPPEGEPPEVRRQRMACEDRARDVHWPELRRTAAFRRLYDQVRRSCQTCAQPPPRPASPHSRPTVRGPLVADLSSLGMAEREARGSFEYDPDGSELIWNWVSVHYDGIEHLLHDHPASSVATRPPGSRSR